MATKQQYHDNASNGHTSLYVSGANDRQGSQSFTTDDAYSISSVKVLIYKINSPGTYTVSIRAASGDAPTGGDLASGEFEGSSITTNVAGEWKEVVFDASYELNATTKYTIVIRYTGGGDSGGSIEWLGVSGSSSYPDGQGTYSFTGGSTWSALARDFNFETWGGPVTRQITLTSPTDEDTGILLQPLLQWSISGDGAQEGDLLDIYFRKDDANFTGDDLLAGLVDATLNSSLQIVAGLEYGATYYWQVQAFTSEEDDLLSSSVFSFTVQSFSPPAYSVHPISGLPTGENNQITVRRLVAIANNKFWYEDI